jgi:hypothetical protein
MRYYLYLWRIKSLLHPLPQRSKVSFRMKARVNWLKCVGPSPLFWWNKPLKELRLATFNARIKTVTTIKAERMKTLNETQGRCHRG